MTRKDFSQKSEVLGRIIAWCVPVFFFTLLGLTIIGQFLSAYIERHYHTNRWDTPGNIFLIVLLFGGLIGITCLEYRLARKWGLACPACGRRFIDKVRRVVLYQGKCPKCKAEVFEDRADIAPLTSHPLNREEFKMKLGDYARQLNRKLIRLMIIAAAVMAGSVPLSKYIQRIVENGDLDGITLTQWSWLAAIMLASVFLSFFGVFILAAMGKFRLRDLPCPECNRPLVGFAGKVALESGMCVYCGCRLFEALPSQNPGKGSL